MTVDVCRGHGLSRKKKKLDFIYRCCFTIHRTDLKWQNYNNNSKDIVTELRISEIPNGSEILQKLLVFNKERDEKKKPQNVKSKMLTKYKFKLTFATFLLSTKHKKDHKS